MSWQESKHSLAGAGARMAKFLTDGEGKGFRRVLELNTPDWSSDKPLHMISKRLN